MASSNIRLAGALLLLATGLAYSNHFHNGFHFDDSHAVYQNPAVRSLRNPERFFTDPATSSILPRLRTYRPLVMLSLAFDYWTGHGYRPLYFHVDAFVWFLLQLVAMMALFRHLLRLVCTEPWTDWAALFAVALYGLHPAMAETVNYIVQRADLYSTMLVVAALAVYALRPRWRRFGLYLVLLALAMLAKQPAAIFPAILFAYIYLFEDRRVLRALARCIPSIAVAALLLALQARMMPSTFVPGSASVASYIATQPWVALHYFLMFFAPVGLTAASGQEPLASIFSAQGIAGLAFLASVITTIEATARRENLRPIAFGLSWFLLALAPTSLYRLFEVENDHRMFFPFVGLALAAGWCAALLAQRVRVPKPVLAACCACILAACVTGTLMRNRVWQDEETLWSDAATKSPHNGFALINYGRALMADEKPKAALQTYERARELEPNYYLLEMNTGLAYAELNLNFDAEEHLRRATQLAPDEAEPNYFYGRWLVSMGRLQEAMVQFRISIANNPEYIDSRRELMQAYVDAGDAAKARTLAADTMRVAPLDAVAQAFLEGRGEPRQPAGAASVARYGRSVIAAEAEAQEMPTAEHYEALSAAYYHAGRFHECIHAAEHALSVQPASANAYVDEAAGYIKLGEWDEAIAAADQAIRIDPDLQLAWNNRAYAEEQKDSYK